MSSAVALASPALWGDAAADSMAGCVCTKGLIAAGFRSLSPPRIHRMQQWILHPAAIFGPAADRGQHLAWDDADLAAGLKDLANVFLCRRLGTGAVFNAGGHKDTRSSISIASSTVASLISIIHSNTVGSCRSRDVSGPRIQENEFSDLPYAVCQKQNCFSDQRVLPEGETTFQIQIILLSGKTLLQWVHDTDLVQDLLYKLELRLGIPSSFQRLLFKGKQLEESLPLSFYNIQRDASIVLALRLRGGSFGQTSSAPPFSYKDAVHKNAAQP